MMLDLEVARLVFRARQIERALNDPGPWEMEYGGLVVPASKLMEEDGLSFLAVFPEQCWLIAPGFVTLLCDGEIAGTKQVDHPGDGSWLCEWRLGIRSLQPVG